MAVKKKHQEPRAAKNSARQTSKKGTCFIIMPFGEWFDYYYDSIYKPAIEAVGLIPRRADDLYRPSSIVNDIWALTQQAKVILADLSGKNPNVFYELGLAHAVAKPAILVTETIDDVPFDLRALRVIVYDKNEPEWGAILRGKIEAAIKEISESPLESVLPAFIKVKESSTLPKTTKAEKELVALKQDVHLIKRELQERVGQPSRISRGGMSLRRALDFTKYALQHGQPERFVIERMNEAGISTESAIEIVNQAKNELRDQKAKETQNYMPNE